MMTLECTGLSLLVVAGTAAPAAQPQTGLINRDSREGAAHSTFTCAGAVSGKDYLQLLAPVFR